MTRTELPDPGPVWLVANPGSGSNSDDTVEGLEANLAAIGYPVARRVCMPRDPLPGADALKDAGIATLVIFTGDGTLNGTICGLEGWDGAVLVLPGGTTNLLSRRLHGEASADEILARLAAGGARPVRPPLIRCEAGEALAEVLVGPGTAWHDVREAMREGGVIKVASQTAQAVAETRTGTPVRLVEPARGSVDGYPAIRAHLGEWGIQIDAYHAESTGEVLQQGVALLKRNFREGPHDVLGLVEEAVLESVGGGPLDCMFDGEAATGPPRLTLRLAPAPAALLATAHA